MDAGGRATHGAVAEDGGNRKYSVLAHPHPPSKPSPLQEEGALIIVTTIKCYADKLQRAQRVALRTLLNYRF